MQPANPEASDESLTADAAVTFELQSVEIFRAMDSWGRRDDEAAGLRCVRRNRERPGGDEHQRHTCPSVREQISVGQR